MKKLLLCLIITLAAVFDIEYVDRSNTGMNDDLLKYESTGFFSK